MIKQLGFKVFGFMIDLARQIERPEVLREAVKGMNKYGYNMCMLYMEDAYAYPRHPGIARKHAYTVDFVREIYEICKKQNMELVPVIPALGHCWYITRKKGYEKYDEGRGTDKIYGTISPSFPETYKLLKELFEDWCLHIPGKYLHVGLDESPHMGQYFLRTHEKKDFNGEKMFAAHCNRLNKIVKSLGRRMVMWGDMFYYYPNAIKLIDKDIVVVDWYYYTFKKTPKVEMFNFTEIDSSGALKKAGLEVWGCPSVYPNYPVSDVREQWQNLLDWIRYGKKTGIDGIINTAWEESVGFYNNSDFLFRAFGNNLIKSKPLPLKKALEETLVEITGNTQTAKLSGDILKLGGHHMKGYESRCMFTRHLATLASAARLQKCRAEYQSIKDIFKNLPDALKGTKTEKGRQLLNTFKVSHELMKFVWHMGMLLPKCYAMLCRKNISESQKNKTTDIFNGLALDAAKLKLSYGKHWCQLRYEDDKQFIDSWLDNVIKTLNEWISLLKTDNFENHPLVVTPRLEYKLICKHPSLTVLRTTIEWKSGHKQVVSDIMVRFKSNYAVSEKKWVWNSVHALNECELPETIKIEADNYGQAGIEKVEVIWRGKKYECKLVKTKGKYAVRKNGVLWLGIIGGAPNLPTIRVESDKAWYKLK